MIDYKEEAKKLIQGLYKPGTLENYDVRLSTGEVLQDLLNIFPGKSLDEYDIYEALTELKFIPFNVPTSINEEDKKETSRIGLKHCWFFICAGK